VQLGDLTVRRLLPIRERRKIGPWCFFDRFGPLQFTGQKPMDVAPHPHIGLQTLTWLFSGEIFHRDSIGSECMITPGQLSLMTAGRGIAHTEETPPRNSGRLEGAQFWIALPEVVRQIAPSYLCTKEPEQRDVRGATITDLIPGQALHSPAAGCEVRLRPGAALELPLDPAYEYGLLLAQGDLNFEHTPLVADRLYYFGVGNDSLELRTQHGATALLLGGAPFPERILMWWNFVARNGAEIESARQGWEQGDIFGTVAGYRGARLAAPAIAGTLSANDR
jgi:hypothetical protein